MLHIFIEEGWKGVVHEITMKVTIKYVRKLGLDDRIITDHSHAGYSDTWDAVRTPRTGKGRVNSYLIFYQNYY